MKISISALPLAIAAASFTSSVHAFGVTHRASTGTIIHAPTFQLNMAMDPIINPNEEEFVEPATPAFTRGISITSENAVEDLPLGIKLTGGEKLRGEGLTGKGVKVAVIDSGVYADHPNFNGQVVQNVWYRRGSSLMEDDHGTHVAGTIHMMAPEAEIYDYRVFGRYGTPVNRAIVEAIDDAIEDGCDIINMSLGGPFPDLSMWRAVRRATRAGIIVVVAAGNEGDNNPLTNENAYPANFRDVLSIAAVSKKDNLPVAYFSNTNSQVDYAGIGVEVTSFRPDGTFQLMSGTSMACPHVCGFITALMTKGGEYSDKITGDASCRELLNDKFCIDIGVEGVDNATGLGFLTYLTKEEFEERFLDLPDHE